MLNYEVGFQLLDRSEDNTRAVGVTGFKVGSQLLYAPTFFIAGDLKGHELLYMKSQDSFVPLKENWINYILRKRPQMLGDSTPRNTSQLGVMQPDLNQLAGGPNKFASAAPTWLREALPGLAAAALHVPKDNPRGVHLCDFLRKEGSWAARSLVKLCSDYPRIGALLDQFHDPAELRSALEEGFRNETASALVSRPRQKQAGSVLDCFHPIKSGSLQIIREAPTNSLLPDVLTVAEREQFLRDGLIVRDKRAEDEVSKAYKVQTEEILRNPDASGVYEVLVRPRQFERAFVAIGPQGPRAKQNYATLVRIGDGESSRNWLNVHSSHIWANKECPEFKEWFDGLPEAKTLEVGDRNVYMAVGPNGEATVPFEVRRSIPSQEGTHSYDVYFRDYAEHRRPAFQSNDNRPRYVSDLATGDAYDDGERIHLGHKLGSKLRATRGDVYVPAGFKLLKVRSADSDEATPIRLGNSADIQLLIGEKTAALKIVNDGIEVLLNGRRFTQKAAFVSLLADHGFAEPAARQMLKEAHAAHVSRRSHVTYRVKYANPFLTDQGPTIPFPQEQSMTDPYMGSGLPMPGPQEQFVQANNPYPNAAEMYSPTAPVEDFGAAVQTVNQAAQTGQREVFDTSLIGTLLKSTRDDTMIDRHLGDMLKALDRLGRLLFSFYWHRDRFADRYGESELPELEDGLRNTFEGLGDLILFLLLRSVDPYVEARQDGIDLGNVAAG